MPQDIKPHQQLIILVFSGIWSDNYVANFIESAIQVWSSCKALLLVDMWLKRKCGNSNCQSDTFIKPSSKMADHGGGGDSPEWKWGCWIPPKRDACFALSEVSFLKLSKTVTEYEFINKYSTKLIMNETKNFMFLKVIFPW